MNTRIRQFAPHPCSRCGEVITNNRSEYCDECWPEYMKLRDLYRVSARHELMERSCRVCGKTFWTRRTGRHYCSDECRDSVEREASRLRAIKYRSERTDEGKQKVSEYQREYRVTHAEEIKEGQRTWKAARQAERRREKALERQDRIEETISRSDRNNLGIVGMHRGIFLPTTGLIRLDRFTILCTKCGKTFKELDMSQALKNANSGRNICPHCSGDPLGIWHSSSFESEIGRLYPNFTMKCYRPEWMEGLELDLYDPESRLAIEFHGIVWHSGFMDRKERNNRLCEHKADLCERNGVQLLQVYQTEWEQHRDIVLDRIDSILHLGMERRFARKLELRTMNDPRTRAELNRFMDANHIQGSAPSQWAVALFDGAGIVAACTFKYGTAYATGGQGKQRKYWELNRYATRLHCSVAGGLSRCIAAFSRAFPEVKGLVSFADRRWTCPARSAYSSSGFVETGRVGPNYLYTDLNAGNPLKNKQYMRKSSIEERAMKNPEGPEARVFSWDKTETEMATELGFYKVYDAGKIRYEMKL